MNEQIKECWIKAAREDSDDKWDTQEEFIERFARLIVRECAEQSMSIGRYNTPSNITPDLAISIAIGLKKHFGIES
jgi:hypothetical protein